MRWLHNDEPISGPHYKILSDERTHAVHISQVTFEDAGTYTVVASNSLGTASHSARMSVDSTSLPKRQYLDSDHRPVNGIAETVAPLQQWKPASRHSPRSTERQVPSSSAQLKMMPGLTVRLSREK